jgi:DNA-directed RNA polymerase subunit K/omega
LWVRLRSAVWIRFTALACVKQPAAQLIMNTTLLASASALVPNNKLLVNMVRLRVRQLASGHRPLILAPPAMGMCDIALGEIAAGKIAWEPDAPLNAEASAAILDFPTPKARKKAA